jgi:hypothetical protein
MPRRKWITAVVSGIVLIALALLLIAALGCSASTRIHGAESTYRRVTETVPAPGDKPPVVRETIEARSRGASGVATGDKGELKLDTTARQAVNGYNAVGGGTATGIVSTGGSWRVWLILSGIAGIAFAAYSLYRRNVRAAIVAGGFGLSLVALAFLPWYVLAVAGAAVAVAWYLSERDARANREAARAVIAGVSASPEPVRETVKRHVAEQADDRDRAVIDEIKRADGLDLLEAKNP